MKKFFNWFNQHGLFSLSLFLLIFIPLYPKVPLFEAIPGYLVRVRLEDVLVLLTAGVWLVQWWQQKIEWRTSFHLGVILYALVGFVSVLVAVLLQQTIPAEPIHVGKSLLHYFRYLEYFSLFFFMLAGVKTKRHLKIAAISLVVTLNLVFAYGLGQRYLQLPAFSTMNREYSKGQSLILNSADKLQATFGGHYDLAAWLVIIMPILLSWFLQTRKTKFKIWLAVSQLMGFWLIWESASKTALAAMLIGMGLVGWYWLYQKIGLVKSFLLTITSGIGFGLVFLLALWSWNKNTLYRLAPFLRPAGYETPIDVNSTPLDETWSENARKYGLSMGIRLDTLWPQALTGFTLNPYTGKGYATLNKIGDAVFTEADSTDNNFLRVLGETGLLGFVTFFGFLAWLIRTLITNPLRNSLEKSLTIGLIAATVGLLVNSVIIDVFAASKVAFTYWAIAGLTLKSHWLSQPEKFLKKEQQRLKAFWQWLTRNWPLMLVGVWAILLIHKRPFTEYSLVQNFALAPKEAKYVAVTDCWLSFESNCLQTYEVGVSAIYSFYLAPFLLIYRSPAMFYFANLILAFGSVWLAFNLLGKITKDKRLAALAVAGLVSWPTIFSLPTKSVPMNLWVFLGLLLVNKLNLKFKISFKPRVKTYFSLGLLLLIGINIGLYKLTASILANFRDSYRPNNFITIRRANNYLSNPDSEPLLLAEVEPVLFDLYSLGGYQTLPISLSDETKIAQQLLDGQQNIFITNANLQNLKSHLEASQLFEKYKHQFGISLKEIDCRHSCNFYQLSSQPVVIPAQPVSWNGVELPAKNSYRLLIANHQIIAQLAQSKPATIQAIKKNLVEFKPDLIFTTGDDSKRFEKDYGENFLLIVEDLLNIPVLPVLDNFTFKTDTIAAAANQRFALDQSWIMTLDAAAHHAAVPQKVMIFDTLLQLEKHPEIKELVIISHSSKWLEYHPENPYFTEDFLTQLEKHPRVEFYFIVNQPLDDQQAKNIENQLPKNARLVFHSQVDENEPITENAFVLELGQTGLEIFDRLL